MEDRGQTDNADVDDADAHALALRYVLGDLEGDALHRFQEQVRQNPALAAHVLQIQAQMSDEGDTEGREKIGVSALVRREMWSENWMPWRRIRLWEYALGGVAAAGLAYIVTVFGQ